MQVLLSSLQVCLVITGKEPLCSNNPLYMMKLISKYYKGNSTDITGLLIESKMVVVHYMIVLSLLRARRKRLKAILLLLLS